jgi:O-antigen/teichoic acid export membrane protein
MIQSYAKGSFILALGQMASTLISAIGVIIIARFLGPTSFGIISIAQIPISISLMLIANGVTNSIITYTAEQRHRGENQNERNIILAGLRINLSIATLVTIIAYLASGIIARDVFQMPELEPLVKILSISILAQVMVNLSSAVFVGSEKMGVRSLIAITYSILKTIVGPSLVFLGFGVIGAAYGTSLPLVISGVIGLAAVFLHLRTLPTSSSVSLSESTGMIIRYSYPLFLSNLLAGGLRQVFSFVLPFIVTASIIGNYAAAMSFTVLVSFFMTPLNTATLPLLSKLKPEDTVFEFVFQNLVKYKALIVFPISAVIIALSDHLVTIFYGEIFHATPLFLRLLMINYFLIGIGSQTIGQLLNSQKETKTSFRRTLIYLTIGIPLGALLIPNYGVVGLIITQTVAPISGLFYSLWWVKKNYLISIDYQTIFKAFVSISVGFVLCSMATSLLKVNPWIEVLIGGSVFMITYLLSILFTGAFTKSNIGDLRSLVEKYDMLNPLVDPFFNILTRLSRF